MGGDTDEVKGRIKQAIGSITADEDLKREGRMDERTGSLKKTAGNAIDAVRDKLKDAADALHPRRSEK